MVFCLANVLVAASVAIIGSDERAEPSRPNILWITCEDISPNLGCYGDRYAVTPNLDRLASQGVRFTHAFAPIGVCAPSRSCLITGMYPPSIGTHHMRCAGRLPDVVKCFPEYLRQAGYYCTNNVKTDYNFQHPATAWDESSNRAHWRNRKPGQAFFAVFNFTSCHESQIRLTEPEYAKRTAQFTPAEFHDPTKAALPPYHPDAPEVRRDWARYADMITFMDKEAGRVLKQLDDDGLADDTIVFYFSDHGAGMPRSKRWLYDSSLRVPFILRCPKKYERLAPGSPGTTCDRLVSFVDFAPTVLSLAGVAIPEHLQGHAFLGDAAAQPREYIYGFRDRMDERYDMIRAVRDRRYKYIRNYMPHLPYFHDQHLSYAWEMPTLRVWQQLSVAGKLSGPQAVFMARSKPMEELYDTEADPHEIHNLAASAEHRDVLERLRREHRRWMTQIVDLGLLPEADLRTRFGDTPEYEAVRNERGNYPMDRIAGAADLAGEVSPANVGRLVELLTDADPAVQFWAATGLGALGDQAKTASDALGAATNNSAPVVQVAAADALARMEFVDRALPVLVRRLSDKNEWVRLYAVCALDRLDDRARPALDMLRTVLSDKNQYVVRVATDAVSELQPPPPQGKSGKP
jgi:uncharacterized sulfatase